MRIITTIWFLAFLTVFSFCQAQTEPQSLWQLSLPAVPGLAGTIYYGDSVIYYFESDQLHATDIQTGQQLWSYNYPITTDDPTSILLAFGEGLAFIPQNQTLLALDEQTGKEVWSYELREDWLDLPLEQIGMNLYYDRGFLFLQTQTHLTALEAKSGNELWGIVLGDVKGFEHIQILNDDIAIMWLLERSGRTLNIVPGIFDLQTGETLWTMQTFFDSDIVKVLEVDSERIDLLTISQSRQFKSVVSYEVRTGEKIFQCSITTRGGTGELEFNHLGPVWAELPINPDVYTFYGTSLYVNSDAQHPAPSIYRFPLCRSENLFSAAPSESVNETTDRYLLQGVVYNNISPFQQVAGPVNDSFLFQKEGQLYKVPVPQELFTYLYHNKTDDSVYIEPNFADIDPPPYELISGIEGKVVKIELIDNLIVTMLEDGTLQVINFDTLETVLKAQTNLDMSNVAFHQQNDVLIVESATIDSRDLIAYQLPSSTQQ